MNTALQTSPNHAPVNRVGAYIVADALKQEGEQRTLLGQYVKEHMVEDTDYGVIPGTTKKTLLKPGAEKLTQLFRCIPRFTIEQTVENWETGLFHYRFKCQIVLQSDESVVAEGVGSCSTFESRYRWRKGDRLCPKCGAAAILRSKFPPKNAPEEEPGWYCFDKKGGCGENFSFNTDSITSQTTGRVQNPDILDQVNTVLKIAKKRAHVDASVALARCSDIFTQDLEDTVEEKAAAKTEQPKPSKTTISEADFEKLLLRKGKTMATACVQWDSIKNTNYVATKATFSQIDPDHINGYAAWLAKQPDAPAVDPRFEVVRKEMARTGRTWSQNMMRLNTMYPDSVVGYSDKTLLVDIESDRLDALITDLKMHGAKEPTPEQVPA